MSVVESLTPTRAQITSTTCITCQDFEAVHAAFSGMQGKTHHSTNPLIIRLSNFQANR
uniref:Uncharacterized protein n=1 Tax=Escherichia coli TaxID=562 RepID=A0A7D7KJD8_ECOLX|nr:hypothetical protein [Escherichia coli]QMS43624.1 hypothetical protein [Escherichia coli]